MSFQGVYTALVTPFKNGKVDFPSVEKLVEQQLKGGVNQFVVNGTTAESPTLSQEESLEILEVVLSLVKNKGHVIFGSGSNNTQKTIEFSQRAVAAGAQGLLLVVPYYNKPPQQGLYEHFKSIAEAVSAPQLLYNVPGRTITSLEVSTIQRLSEFKNIVGIKEATGNLDLALQIQKACPSQFRMLSGDDESCLLMQKNGGHGVISVCSHIMPQKMSEWFSGTVTEKSLQEFKDAQELIKTLYISTNPIPVKAAMAMLGVIASDEMRLPLVRLDAEQLKKVETSLKNYERFL